MEDTRNEYRNPMKKLFKKYGIHRAIRSDTLNDLIDEVNTYYQEKETSVDKAVKELDKFHEQHLREQLTGWIEYLTNEKDKIVVDDSDYNAGIRDGFEKFLQALKDVAER